VPAERLLGPHPDGEEALGKRSRRRNEVAREDGFDVAAAIAPGPQGRRTRLVADSRLLRSSRVDCSTESGASIMASSMSSLG
jgi:hypothetical protein